MKLRLNTKFDKSHLSYACIVQESDIHPYLYLFREKKKDKTESLLNNKFNRDGINSFHLTILIPSEIKESGYIVDISKSFEIELKGIGSVSDHTSEAYFIVCESPEILRFRQENGFLNPYYPHITLGFSKYDIHGIPKNKIFWTI
jgi:hypothetical protein